MEAGLSAPQEGTSDQIMGKTLPAQQLYQHDPLMVVLKDKLHVNDIASIAGMAVLTGIVLIGLAAFAGAHFDIQGASFPATLRVLITTLVLVPILFGVYLWLPNYIANTFNTLQGNGVIGDYRKDRPGSESYEVFLRKLCSWTDNVWWTIAGVVFVALCWLFQLFIIDPQFAILPPLWFRIAQLIVYSPALYGAFLSIIRLVIMLVFTNWLFHLYTIHLNPLHPDGSAGLGSLGNMLIVSAVLMVTIGVSTLLIHPEFLTGSLNDLSRLQAVLFGVVYVVLTVGLVLGWLLLPHQVMQDARDEALKPLADQFEQAIYDSTPSAKQDASAIRAETDRLAELKRRYELLQDTIPVWPMEIAQIQRVVATISLPAIIPICLPFLKDGITYIGHLFGH